MGSIFSCCKSDDSAQNYMSYTAGVNDTKRCHQNSLYNPAESINPFTPYKF